LGNTTDHYDGVWHSKTCGDGTKHRAEKKIFLFYRSIEKTDTKQLTGYLMLQVLHVPGACAEEVAECCNILHYRL